MMNYHVMNEKLLDSTRSAVTHGVSVNETTMAAIVGEFFLNLEIYKPAMYSERLDDSHSFSDTDSHL